MGSLEIEPQGLSSKSEASDRRSVDFFLGIKDQMIKQIGISNTRDLKYSLYKLTNVLSDFRNLDTVKKDRSGFIKKMSDPFADKFRKNLPDHFRDRAIPFSINEDFAREMKNADLERLRQSILEYLKENASHEAPLSVLHEIELFPEIKELLVKYKKTKLHELLEPGLKITRSDLFRFVDYISVSFEYRNRKIKEFVAYRYARSAPTEIGIDKFVLNAYRIIKDEGFENEFRNIPLKNDYNFNAPVDPRFVKYGMYKINERIKELKSFEDESKVEKEALKSYILFEIIHPFRDGNGRVGRALFVYLQRILSAKKSSLAIPTHIPISRFESGSISSQEVLDGKYTFNMPGSLSLDVNTIVNRILLRADIVVLGKNLYNSPSLESRRKFDIFFNGILAILESKEADTELDNLISVIKKQSLLDDIGSADWNMVYESARRNLRRH